MTDCLEFVRPVKISQEKVNLVSLLDESILIALSTIDKKEIGLQKNFLPTPPVSVDYNQMKQVVVNILVNALQVVKGSWKH